VVAGSYHRPEEISERKCLVDIGKRLIEERGIVLGVVSFNDDDKIAIEALKVLRTPASTGRPVCYGIAYDERSVREERGFEALTT
jgi:hypothetical protein